MGPNLCQRRGWLCDADHRVASDKCRELVLPQLFCSCRSARDHEVAEVSSRVDDTDLDFVLELDSKLFKHATGIGDGP